MTTPSTDFNSYILTNRIEAVAATIGKVTMEMTVTQLTSDISKYEVALLDLEIQVIISLFHLFLTMVLILNGKKRST